MSMNPFSPVGPSGGFSLTPEQLQLRINRLINGDYRTAGETRDQYLMRTGQLASSGQNTVTVPGVGANITNESELARLLRLRSLLDPMSQAMWDADPRNQAEIARLRREEAGLPPEAVPRQPGDNSPNQPPPGGWGDTNTYEDIFGPAPTPPPGTDTTAALVAWINTLTPAQRVQWSKSPRTAGQIRALNQEGYAIDPNGNLTTPAATPPAAPQRPGTVPGSVWNNPESAAPRGYNPELWAQREIGPNRTSAGVGGPRNADGTAMYAPPPEYKPTRGIDPFGYEPAPRKQAEFSGFTIGDDGFYRSDRGGSGAAYDENLLRTLKAAADAGEGRANYILSALSTGADMTRPVFSAKMNQYGANPIDNYAAQYDWQQEVLGKKEMQRKLKQGWTVDENRQLVPPSGWVEDNNGGWRPPLDDSSWTQVGNGSRWVRTENTSTEPKVPDMGKDDKERKNPFMPRMAGGSVAISQARNDLNRMVENAAMYPGRYSSADISRANSALQQIVSNAATNPFLSSLADSTRRMPVHTMPSERVPTPMQRGPAVPGRLPIQTPAGTHLLTFLAQTPAPNPFLSGGATRGYRNPFR